MKLNKLVYVLFVILVSFTMTLINCKKEQSTENTENQPASSGAALSDEEQKGKELFIMNCASCHGESGTGDGPASASLNPKPRNYKAPAAEWKNGNTEEGVLKTINNGIAGSPMVAYKHLGDDNVKLIVKYVLYLTKN